MKKVLNSIFVIVLAALIIAACKKKDDNIEPTTGILYGTVTDAPTGAVLNGVLIIIYNSNTNSPTGTTLSTNSEGNYSVELTGGSYYLKLCKQGYKSVPPTGITPLPITVLNGESVESSYQMNVSDVVNGGIISGTVTVAGSTVTGVLVVAYNGSDGCSSVSDYNGNYFIFNVPADNYSVKGWMSGYNSSEANVNVTAGSDNSGINITLISGVSGSVEGQITFLATTNIEVDISLAHPGTKETIPGLSTITVSGNYSIINVPNGTYLARATYENDTKVIDPDWIIKNGEPIVTVSDNTITMDFSVTGAVDLISPTNAAITTVPYEINTTTPEFSWNSYPSSNDYVIEVMDVNGNVIWGGFSDDWTIKNIVIPKTQTSISYNSDGNAAEPLETDNIYRWRLYASKDDSQEPTGWKLISVSEDQRGLIKIVP